MSKQKTYVFALYGYIISIDTPAYAFPSNNNNNSVALKI